MFTGVDTTHLVMLNRLKAHHSEWSVHVTVNRAAVPPYLFPLVSNILRVIISIGLVPTLSPQAKSTSHLPGWVTPLLLLEIDCICGQDGRKPLPRSTPEQTSSS